MNRNQNILLPHLALKTIGKINNKDEEIKTKQTKNQEDRARLFKTNDVVC